MQKVKKSKFKELAKRIRRMNDWRRGAGEFEQNGPDENYIPIPPPESPENWGKLLDEAADILESINTAKCFGKEQKCR